MKKKFSLNLRSVSLVAVLAGVAGSLGLVIYNGRNNKSILLIALFVVWVLSPYVGLLIANKASKGREVNSRKTLYITMLVLPVISLISYSGLLSPAGTKTAFVFLVVPFLSWVLIAIILLLARSQSR